MAKKKKTTGKMARTSVSRDQERNKALKAELWRLRMDVIYGAPLAFQEMLDYLHGTLERDWNLYTWQQTTIEKIIAATKITSPAPNGFFRDRALCPLCGDSPMSEPNGFAIPSGLYQHLEGKMRLDECRVMRAARTLLRAQHAEQFPEAYSWVID